MSLPPALWEESAALPAIPTRQQRPAGIELVLSMIWGARNEGARERFKARLEQTSLKATWVHTEDGWSLPLWRCAPKPGSSGEPIILAADLCLGPLSMDLSGSRSLVHYFHQLGYDVYVFGHRGAPEATPPRNKTSIDFDHIVRHDVPAAIATVRSIANANRVHWIGHGFGGQCLIGHLAHDGARDLAASALLSAPVKFKPYKTTLRRVATIAGRLPQAWRIPMHRIQELLTVASKPTDLSKLTLRVEGPMARALLMDATTDLAVGLIKQLNNWHEHGHLTDATNTFDYLEGIEGCRSYTLVVGSPSDNLCQPEAARPVVDKLAPDYSEWLCMPDGWAHLDLIAGADAPRVLYPRLAEWLKKHDARCWTDS